MTFVEFTLPLSLLIYNEFLIFVSV